MVKSNKKFYVYVHTTENDDIFYVGKGTGKRAWKKDRHDIWQYYVENYLDNNYKVKIIKKNLTEQEALEFERELIKKHGKNLVNWVNLEREINYEVYDKYNKLVEEKEELIKKAKKLESKNLKKSVDKYKKAYQKLKKYSDLNLEKRDCLVLKLHDEMNLETGDTHLIDRLSVSLKRLERWDELIYYVDKYFNDFPGFRRLKKADRILKRKKYAKSKLDI